VPWALVALGGGYAGSLLLGADRLDGFAPVYAACLITVGELAYWSLGSTGDEPAGVLRRLLTVLALALASLVVGGLVLASGELSLGGGLVLETAGMAAAVGAMALVALLAGRRRG